MGPMKDPYKVLGITKGASKLEAKKAFNKLALTYHPDRSSGADDVFKRVLEAYNQIRDEGSKERLDIEGFESRYRGSQEEIEEIKLLYKRYGGDICRMIDNMIIGKDEDEERIRSYIERWIETGDVVRYPKFKKKVSDNKKRLLSRRREAAKAEKLVLQDISTGKRSWGEFLKDLEDRYSVKHLCNKRKNKSTKRRTKNNSVGINE